MKKNIKLNKIITVEAGKRQSKPCIRGMRISVHDIIAWLDLGMTAQEIITDFPELTKRDIASCSRFSRDRENNQVVVKL